MRGQAGARLDPVAMIRPSYVDVASPSSSCRRCCARARSRPVARAPSRQSRSRSSTPCFRSTMSSASAFPGEAVLRERRPVVGQVRLGTDRDDAAVEAVAAQRLGGAQTRERHADDRDRAHRRTASSCVRRTLPRTHFGPTGVPRIGRESDADVILARPFRVPRTLDTVAATDPFPEPSHAEPSPGRRRLGPAAAPARRRPRHVPEPEDDRGDRRVRSSPRNRTRR